MGADGEDNPDDEFNNDQDKIDNEADLGDALNDDKDRIEIEGDLAKKVLRIKATGKAAWIIAFGLICVAVIATPATGGTSGVIGSGAIAILGLPAATSAVSIAIAAGNVNALKKLRNYKILEHSAGKLVLVKG